MENTYNKPEVNHIDGNKQNNSVMNLEFCTHSENMQHAVKNGLKKRAFSIEMIDQKTEEVIRTFPSINSAAVFLGKHRCNSIWMCANGITNQAYGYKWRLVNPLNKVVETRATDGKRNCKSHAR